MVKSIVLSLIGAAVVGAQQTVLSNDACLAPSSSDAVLEYAACCPDNDSGGVKSILGIPVKYTCNSYPIGAAIGPPQDVANAFECAKLCAETQTCQASTWSPAGWVTKCYLYEKGYTPSKTIGNWLLFAKPDDPVPTDPIATCQDQINAALVDAKAEAAQQCETEKAVLRAQHKQELDACKANNQPKPAPAPAPPSVPQCSYQNGATVSRAGKTWTVYCYGYVKRNDHAHWGVEDLGIDHGVSDLAGCMDRCARRTGCATTYWQENRCRYGSRNKGTLAPYHNSHVAFAR